MSHCSFLPHSRDSVSEFDHEKVAVDLDFVPVVVVVVVDQFDRRFCPKLYFRLIGFDPVHQPFINAWKVLRAFLPSPSIELKSFRRREMMMLCVDPLHPPRYEIDCRIMESRRFPADGVKRNNLFCGLQIANRVD